MTSKLGKAELDLLFNEARTHYKWLDKEVSNDKLKEIYDLMKMGPTAVNCCPIRIVFVKSKEAKESLKPHIDAGNVEKTMTASVTAILGMDTKFYDKLPQLFAHAPARDWFVGNEKLSGETAFRNSTLQGGYFIIAARSLGLDCGPMSGFSKEGIDKTFFAGTSFTANFLCNLGYGDNASLFPRGARLAFEESCRVV